MGSASEGVNSEGVKQVHMKVGVCNGVGDAHRGGAYLVQSGLAATSVSRLPRRRVVWTRYIHDTV
jgi:hypothetical protein